MVAEVALAVVLLVGSGLFLESFARVTNVDLGLDPGDVLTVRVRVQEASADAQQAAQRNRRLLLNVLTVSAPFPVSRLRHWLVADSRFAAISRHSLSGFPAANCHGTQTSR